MNRIIYRLKRYRHNELVVCPFCLMNPSIGKTDLNILGCIICQNNVDRAVEAQFTVLEEVA